uniref:Uncharacterized protein n=1 Tax=Arundo donax TaxID=35708 RepID=A0A0A8YIA4_ARUDO
MFLLRTRAVQQWCFTERCCGHVPFFFQAIELDEIADRMTFFDCVPSLGQV